MRNNLRDLRKSRGLTLADVAARCIPPTTAVTIGRLETGTRGLSMAWVDRLAAALEVDPRALLLTESDPDVPVAALLEADGPEAPTQRIAVAAPVPPPGAIALIVRAAQGDYRAGDQLWLDQIPPDRFAEALNTDVLVPRPVGRFAFGRLIALDKTRLQLLPLKSGSRQMVVADAPWVGRVRTVIRSV